MDVLLVAVGRRLGGARGGAPKAEIRRDAADAVRPLSPRHRAGLPRGRCGLPATAYDVADTWHSGQFRNPGRPYIHLTPLCVAILLADSGMTTTTGLFRPRCC